MTKASMREVLGETPPTTGAKWTGRQLGCLNYLDSAVLRSIGEVKTGEVFTCKRRWAPKGTPSPAQSRSGERRESAGDRARTTRRNSAACTTPDLPAGSSQYDARASGDGKMERHDPKTTIGGLSRLICRCQRAWSAAGSHRHGRHRGGTPGGARPSTTTTCWRPRRSGRDHQRHDILLIEPVSSAGTRPRQEFTTTTSPA